jgi:hypothetical protein
MQHSTSRSRTKFKFVLVALGAVALGAPTGAEAQQSHADFVAGRLELAQPALAGCVTSVTDARPATPPLVEVTIQDRNVTLQTISPDTTPAWRTCIENALRGALVISAGQAGSLPRSQGFMTVSVTLGIAGPTAQPASPTYAAGQRVRILWGSSWYDGTIVAVQGPNRFLVHYEGWSSSSDEVVGTDRLAQVAGTTTTPAPATVTPARFAITPGTPSRPGRPGRPIPQPQPQPVPQPIPPVVVVPPSTQGNLLTNGGFEAPALANGAWNVFPTIAGWRTVSGPGIEVQAGAAGLPAEGRQLVELDSHAPTSIAQDVATSPRQRYEIRLSFAARAGTNRGTNRLAIVWDGQVVARIDADGTGTDQPRWVTVSYFVTARGRQATLELRDEGTADSVGTYIDNVSVTPAP